VLSTNLNKLCKSAGPNLLCWAKLVCFYFSSYNFNLQGHILSTAGVALRAHQPTQPYWDLYQCLSHLTSLEARTPAPFKVHGTVEQMAFDGKSAVGFEVWTLEQMKQWPQYPTRLMMIDTSTRLYADFLLSLIKKRLLVQLSSSLDCTRFGDFAALTRKYKAWMDRIIGRGPTSVLLTNFLMQPIWQLSGERCKRSGDHP